MTLKVSTTHAQRVAAALDDNRQIAKLFERTATNVWTLIENDQVGHYGPDETRDMAITVDLPLEDAGIPFEEYDIEF